MAEVIRQEKKYLITQSQRIQLQHQFSAMIKPDPHNGTEGYRVRSLYFDTLNDRDFQEKEDGVERRRKLRLRVSILKEILHCWKSSRRKALTNANAR